MVSRKYKRLNARVWAVAIDAAIVAIAAGLLLFSCAPKGEPLSSVIIGSWQGALVIQGRTLVVVVHFEKDGKARMDIVSTGSGGSDAAGKSFPLVNVLFRPPRIDFDLQAGSDLAAFRGKIEGNRIEGSFVQAGQKGTFGLTRSGAEAESQPADSGTPVVLQTPTGDIHGSLILPKGDGPFPIVLIISGQGAMDRNGNIADVHVRNNCLELLAQALARRGFASIRYDKRGVGASAAALRPGAPLLFTSLIDDAAAWVANLKTDTRFRGVAVLGYGEGALVGMVAARQAGAGAFVSVAGPGEPAAAILKEQFAGQPIAIRDQVYHIIDLLSEGKQVSVSGNNLQSLFGSREQPFLISKFRFNPQVEIAKLTVPVLIVQGMSDLQTGVFEAELLHRAAPGSYMDLIRGMNHVLRDVPRSPQANLASYANPDLPLDSELINVTSEFLRMALKVPPP